MRLVLIIAAILIVGFGSYPVNAQTQITSENVLTPTVGAWTGSVLGQNGGFSGGGNGPAYNPNTNTLIFGYTTATATQRITAEAFAIQHALDLSNSGIKINGYNYSWLINNSGDQSGTLSGQVQFLRGTSVLRTDIYNYNSPTNGFELKTGTHIFDTQESMLAGDSMTLSFTGKDSRFWAGYYGPQVRQPSLTLNYTTDPCMANPLYSPSCSGYNNVITSQNILGNQYGVQSYAINQALSLSGSGVQINGFRYGYDLYVGGQWCSVAAINADGTLGCGQYDASSMAVGVAVTDNNANVIYSNAHLHTEQNTFGSYSYSYVFPTQRTADSMGAFALSPSQYGTGALYNSWSNWQYTPDPCVVNPLSSTTCSGYQAAYQAQMCAANPTYNSACPGYAEAIFTQQCTAIPLSNPSCPGYASAYLTYQCSINPLYSTTCSGYAEAYKTQQCSLDGLYDRTCPNYSTAYATKMVLEQQGTASIVATAGTVARNDPANAPVSTTTASTTVGSDGAVSTGVSATGDTNVDKAITNKASTTNTAPAAVQLAPPPPPPQQMAQNEPKGGGDKPEPKGGNKQEDKKDDAPKGSGGNSPQNTNTASSDKPAAPTARQALQERREAAAKAEAVEKGKNLANEMGKASDLEAQKAVQNVVIQAMGFTPGFDSYGKAMLPDVVGYKPYSVYNNQRNVENRATLRMFGGTDKLHNDMVESQYQLGK
jgi:hypothetical protein